MKMDTRQLEGVGRQVVAAREALGWSQTELAARAGFTDNTIRKVENGVRVAPATFRKVLDTVGIAPEVDQMQKIGYPRDVQALMDLVGMYLTAIPEDDRPEVMFEITRRLLERSNGKTSAERPITGE